MCKKNTIREKRLVEKREKVPLKRLNKPIDVARMLAFLCAEESGLMTEA